ncbi:hypothetical protein TTHERM_000289379 (macronuclear) [Tetrahymena thermophila SB210]|uniref:Uncharacterized protein n=1 Tax=Tetrahymena thermophila (strain SB210) TaxID=312017 RepID=W7XBG0_TETTS|nr:hypothetical protein TTHERM_000289379 [Tetrahymena thermophila SB210]EWS73753.1 hypothetical protein TTHERM_000289379 [Tetrahymena thermophila SB210]|eukprot:XP_012653717.1 hypothetical protein TTHERM_000289379 [Tetrahymena thermophila SB210]
MFCFTKNNSVSLSLMFLSVFRIKAYIIGSQKFSKLTNIQLIQGVITLLQSQGEFEIRRDIQLAKLLYQAGFQQILKSQNIQLLLQNEIKLISGQYSRHIPIQAKTISLKRRKFALSKSVCNNFSHNQFNWEIPPFQQKNSAAKGLNEKILQRTFTIRILYSVKISIIDSQFYRSRTNSKSFSAMQSRGGLISLSNQQIKPSSIFRYQKLSSYLFKTLKINQSISSGFNYGYSYSSIQQYYKAFRIYSLNQQQILIQQIIKFDLIRDSINYILQFLYKIITFN